MNPENKSIRVLYSFPHKLGAGRICYTAWQQVNGLAAAGVEIHARVGAIQKAVPPNVSIKTTLAWGKFRLPYKLVGSMRAFALHDWLVARELEKSKGRIDIVHTWPLGARETLVVANRLGIPTVLERPNAHTRYAYESVKRECERVGVSLPPDHEHAYKQDVLDREEEEYGLATRLLCPSDFVLKTFVDEGFSRDKLVRHIYGFDEQRFYPDLKRERSSGSGLTLLFVGVCAVRKGLHLALEAWLKSPACKDGTFLIAGDFLTEYRERLSDQLSHPSVHVLGHRKDVPELMRKSDVLILPTIEEGSALVTSEARASGCVLLVSDAAGANCLHMENALVHHVGDVLTLSRQITQLREDRELLARLRAASLSTVREITWTAAGRKLAEVYRDVVNEMGPRQSGTPESSTSVALA
jgi:glycosyltransferase involved in cell wall biosynthesis